MTVETEESTATSTEVYLFVIVTSFTFSFHDSLNNEYMAIEINTAKKEVIKVYQIGTCVGDVKERKDNLNKGVTKFITGILSRKFNVFVSTFVIILVMVEDSVAESVGQLELGS